MEFTRILVQFLSLLITFCLNLTDRLTASIYINSSGYEHCIFHVVQHNQTPTIFSRDLIENIVTNSQGSQVWTILQADRQLTYLKHLKQSCIVNIVVAMGNCSEDYLNQTLRTLGLFKENTLIALVSKEGGCSQVKLLNSSFDYSYKFLESTNLDESSAYIFCSSCSKSFQSFNFNYKLLGISLHRLQKISSNNKNYSMVREIALFAVGAGGTYDDLQIRAFKFMYPKNLDEKKFRYIGGNAETIFMENAANFLNMSLEYFNFEVTSVTSIKYLLSQTQKHFTGIAIMATGVSIHKHWGGIPSSKYKVIFVILDTERFLYCVEKD